MAIKQKYRVYVSAVLAEGFTAVSSFNTDSIDWSNYSGSWVVTVTRSLSDGTPRFTVQCSDDGTNWANYGATSTSLTMPLKFEDETFRPNYIRFVYTSSGSPTGTIDILLHQVI